MSLGDKVVAIGCVVFILFIIACFLTVIIYEHVIYNKCEHRKCDGTWKVISRGVGNNDKDLVCNCCGTSWTTSWVIETKMEKYS